jgi:hypothetical protein
MESKSDKGFSSFVNKMYPTIPNLSTKKFPPSGGYKGVGQRLSEVGVLFLDLWWSVLLEQQLWRPLFS